MKDPLAINVLCQDCLQKLQLVELHLLSQLLHFLINQKGGIYRLVKDEHISWHAGKSCWGKYKNLNKNSIGIELTKKGHQFGYTNYKKKQLMSLFTTLKN